MTALARRGVSLVIAAPSGAGKSSVSRALLAAEPDLSLSVSATTRAPRPGEPKLDLAGGAVKRRDVWPSREEALRTLQARPSFQVWDPRMLEIFVVRAVSYGCKYSLYPSYVEPGPERPANGAVPGQDRRDTELSQGSRSGEYRISGGASHAAMNSRGRRPVTGTW